MAKSMWPDDIAYAVEKRGLLTLSVVRTSLGHWCGYVRFPICPMITERGYDGILTYVSVHGGITLAKSEEHSMTYGFDCGHYMDDSNPECQDPEWVMEETGRMAKAILVAAFFDLPYVLTANWRWGRIRVVVTYDWIMHKMGMDLIVGDNFGVMLNLLCGRL